jgi:tRNA threonylcarbamoyladenosine biosynthesis protein TsaB
LEVVDLVGGTFSAQLIPQVAALLTKHGLGKNDIEGFAVTSGPGSFTGLRVGLAAIKALAEVLAKPIAAVSMLEAVAAAQNGGRAMSALDAGRSEVYVGEYLDGIVVNESLLTVAEFLEAAKGWPVITPDASLASAAQSAGLQVQQIERPRSDTIARLGWLKINAGNTVSAEALEANYIRRSDAEIFSHPK